MSRPVHFEIPASNPETLMQFFTTCFGWQFHKWDGPMPYWLITTGDKAKRGIDGGLLSRQDPAQPIVNTIEVADLDQTLATVAANGGQTVVPRMPIPEVGWLAYIKDPEGNMHGLLQPDTNAK